MTQYIKGGSQLRGRCSDLWKDHRESQEGNYEGGEVECWMVMSCRRYNQNRAYIAPGPALVEQYCTLIEDIVHG